MFSTLQATVVMCWICLLSNGSSTYELQDTIHTLKEENLHLQHQLENLTRALGDLRHLLMEHPGASGGVHDPEYLHAWREWTQHGISVETQQMLEQALCSNDLSNAAQSAFKPPGFFILFSFASLTFTVLS